MRYNTIKILYILIKSHNKFKSTFCTDVILLRYKLHNSRAILKCEKNEPCTNDSELKFW